MAIKIAGTTVIDDSRNFLNITSTTGQYYTFNPVVDTAGSALDFNNPVYYRQLNANLTLTSYTNTDVGKSKILLLNLNGFTLGFGSGITWQGGLIPDFTTFQYWVISFTCYTGGRLLGVAMGSNHGEGPASYLIPLTHPTGLYAVNISPGEDAFASLTIKTDGTIDTLINDEQGPRTTNTDWLDVAGGGVASEYEVVTILDSGVAPNIGTIGTFTLSNNYIIGNSVIAANVENRESNIILRIQEIANPSNFVEITPGTFGNLQIVADNTGN